MRILALGEELWQDRDEIFAWCEQAFGTYEIGSQRWKFFSSYAGLPARVPREIHISFRDEADELLFTLRWL